MGSNLRSNHTYELEVVVSGASLGFYADGIEIGRYRLTTSSLARLPCGLYCLGQGRITFDSISIKATRPKVFAAMQFQSPEYEALYQDVIEPICQSSGLQAYRADSTYMPGLIIEDIKKQILESRIIIAEITPHNPNVYYEVGYADALNKPVILISDRKEGMKPFDVGAYRTIFYDNSIGGKNRIENDLKAYLKGIMEA